MSELTLEGDTRPVDGLARAAEQGSENSGSDCLKLEIEHTFEHIYLEL
jgi:hypothetical protein